MSKILTILILIFWLNTPVWAYTRWENSPYNYSNSNHNYNNTRYDYRNSPYNYNNSRHNPDANLIYNSVGQAVGYVVEKEDGTGANVYNFDGDREGYYNY